MVLCLQVGYQVGLVRLLEGDGFVLKTGVGRIQVLNELDGIGDLCGSQRR